MQHDPSDGDSSGQNDPVGIVVQDGRRAPRQPRAVAFIWGRAVRPAPSLPFGRWKAEVPTAA
ncbi:hypothetical protein BH20GEM3_BH20GEM3_11180 [soil metagenome]